MGLGPFGLGLVTGGLRLRPKSTYHYVRKESFLAQCESFKNHESLPGTETKTELLGTKLAKCLALPSNSVSVPGLPVIVSGPSVLISVVRNVIFLVSTTALSFVIIFKSRNGLINWLQKIITTTVSVRFLCMQRSDEFTFSDYLGERQ
jgi:hypothetical protein